MHPSASSPTYGTVGGPSSYGHPVSVPSSRDGALVFPVDRQKGKVEYWMYSPAMTQGAISIEEVAEFLQGIDAFVQPIFKSKLITFFKWFPCIFFLGFIGTFGLYFACMFGAITTDVPVYILPLVFAGTILSLAAFAAVIQCMLNSHIKKKTQEAKEKIQPYLQYHNGRFQARGYFWVAPVHFPYWVELWRETPAQGMPMVSGVIQGEQVYVQETPNYGIGGVELQPRMQKGYMELV